MKAIDPVMIKKAIESGQLETYISKGKVYIRDTTSGDCVCIYEGTVRNKIQRIFNPTPEEQEEDRLRFEQLIAEATEKRLCCACTHFYDYSTGVSTDFGCKLGNNNTAICGENEGNCIYWEFKGK